ncbi:MAG: hypothetical protein RRC34_15590 [Lentisphaeria bacterium]|nr:hypothetical protein [Lentisphaeria bacterium]
MAIDLTGIGNINEFYTDHYLAAVLENDLKDLFRTWTEMDREKTGQISPPRALNNLHKPYFRLLSELERAWDPAEIAARQRTLIAELLHALGYSLQPTEISLDGLGKKEDNVVLPILGGVKNAAGAPLLWIIETICPVEEMQSPLDQQLDPCQIADSALSSLPEHESLEELISKRIFSLPEPPRWVLAINLGGIELIDRSKWAEKRLLRFDVKEIFDRRESTTLRAMAALLHRESVCPEEGMPLLDTLAENSHKHAYAVSEDLKYAAREAIELLGNEAVYYIREVRKEAIFGKTGKPVLDEAELTNECLRYLYRLLFLFYIEAREELGYAPLNSEEYRLGYSLESLRNLEMVPLTTDDARNGMYIDQSITLLFKLLYEGFEPSKNKQALLGGLQGSLHHTFDMAPLKSHLFDPSRTPILNKVKFRNHVLQRVLKLLSLSTGRGQSGRNHRSGRISYAQLGINQLGAVYEGLLSYSGFFVAREGGLYEVRNPKDDYNELHNAYFVPAHELEHYSKAERFIPQLDPDTGKTVERLRHFPRGTFIYRLAGRNRQKSASYYTPECLTQCVVKYALKELLKDKSADEILHLTICEPAMGSGAFLNEAINQLAAAYLQAKQREAKNGALRQTPLGDVQTSPRPLSSRDVRNPQTESPPADSAHPVADASRDESTVDAISLPCAAAPAVCGISSSGTPEGEIPRTRDEGSGESRRPGGGSGAEPLTVLGHDEYGQELQRVKAYIAANNVYGVDLNSVAVELAEVSLWLNTIHPGCPVPWLNMQLVAGNSLIGTRRQAYKSSLLNPKKGDPKWLDEPPVHYPLNPNVGVSHPEPRAGASRLPGPLTQVSGILPAEASDKIPETMANASRGNKHEVDAPVGEVGGAASAAASSPTQDEGGPGEVWTSPGGGVGAGPRRPSRSVYHFLLPDTNMSAYSDKVVKGMVEYETDDGKTRSRFDDIRDWRRDFCKPFEEHQIDILERLSHQIDQLWQKHIRDRRELRSKTRDQWTLYGQSSCEAGSPVSGISSTGTPAGAIPGTSLGRSGGTRSSGAGSGVQNPSLPSLTTREKDKLFREKILAKEIQNSSAYRRLKLVMDYWCALWFWPIEKADQLPTREAYLMELQAILEGGVYDVRYFEGNQALLDLEGVGKQPDLPYGDSEYGFVNIDALCKNYERLALVSELGKRYRFHHWELEFADLFAERGGFDLILGNPPWLKVEWSEGGVLGDVNPRFVFDKLSASQLNKSREQALEDHPGLRELYLSEFEEADGTQTFLNATSNYPVLKGVQTNLYKCFLPQAWTIGNPAGVSGFLHPEGTYDDPKGGELRKQIYPRLCHHFQFDNELHLFAEVHHCTKFSVNTYRNSLRNPHFDHIANLFATSTVDLSYAHAGQGPVEGIKDSESNWNVHGHRNRVVRVDKDVLALFAKLYDDAGTPALAARLPALHATDVLAVLAKFADQPRRLGDLQGQYFSTEMWHETNAQKDETIQRETRFAESAEEWILSGPHFFVGNPFNKTPRRECTKNSDYDPIDLSIIPDDYLPRTNYVPACSPQEYARRTPHVPWDADGNPTEKKSEQVRVTECYRMMHRRQLSQSGERTFVPSLIPTGAGHINPVVSTAFRVDASPLDFLPFAVSLPFDFYTKSTGKGDMYGNNLGMFPLPSANSAMVLRALRLLALTTHYADLWSSCWDEAFKRDRWAKDDPRLDHATFANLTPEWTRDCALRTDFERRQALVEIDVLAAMALGLTCDELCAIYRIQFPVLRQNEADTWYDQNGRIVFTCSKGLPGVGLDRQSWNEIRKLNEVVSGEWEVASGKGEVASIM